MQRHGEVIAQHARHVGLPPRRGLHQCLSPLAQISQLVPAFDFPRRHLPANFHAVGLLQTPSLTETGTAPWPPLPQPVVYASLGTLQGQRFRLFLHLAQACRQRKLSLVIAHCGGLTREQTQQLQHAGAAWVTDFLDQRAALQHATLFITHAGLNSALEALACGTPMLALPLAFDQPGVASRIEWHGVGRRASRFSRVHQLENHLQQLLDDARYRQHLSAIQPQLIRAGGSERAADIAEQASLHQRAVLARAH